MPAASDHDRLLDAQYTGGLPIRGFVDQKGKVGDLLGTFWASLYLIGDRFKKLLEENAIGGWRAYPTICEGLQSPGEWWVLGIAGRGGSVRTGQEAARAGLDPLDQGLDPREWDGSDLFHPANEGTILVTTRAAQVLERAHLKNVVLERTGFTPISR